MTATAFKLFADDQPASAELARSIEEIEVHQTMDSTWEAQLVIASRLDGRGQWTREAEDHLARHRRMRVEIRAGGEWVPLIDGPTVGVDVDLSGDPNHSRTTIRVRDDSAFLDGDEAEHVSEPGAELEQVIRDAIAGAPGVTLTPEIDLGEAATSEGGPPRSFTMRGTVWAFLGRLARDRALYVRVVPHAAGAAGPSRLVFGPLPQPDGGDRPPALVLAGAARNIESFGAYVASDQPGRAVAAGISIGDRTVVNHRASLRDTELLGDDLAVADDEAAVLVEPGAAERVGPRDAAAAVLRRRGFVIDAGGTVEGRCYSGVLRPFDYVDVVGVNPRLTGAYLVQSVTHAITRAGYRQHFTLWRNALTDDNRTDPMGGIF